MPPLNHRMSEVERSGSVYTVRVTEQNTGPNGESTFEKDTHFVESFEAAVRVAINEVVGGVRVKDAKNSMLYFYQSHDDGEKYLQAVVRERRTFALRP